MEIWCIVPSTCPFCLCLPCSINSIRTSLLHYILSSSAVLCPSDDLWKSTDSRVIEFRLLSSIQPNFFTRPFAVQCPPNYLTCTNNTFSHKSVKITNSVTFFHTNRNRAAAGERSNKDIQEYLFQD